MEPNFSTYILVNYSLSTIPNIDELRRVYPDLVFTQITLGLYTVGVPVGSEAELERLRRDISFVIEPTLYGLNAQAALEASNISIFHDYPYGALRGNGVLVGFIDTGIDYTNSLFQNANGTTRIMGLWDQSIEGNPPAPFNYGTFYGEEELNAALQTDDPYSVVPSRDEIGHGTFLAGVAAGNDQTDNPTFVGGAPDASILMVKLRPAEDALREYYLVSGETPAYQNNDIISGISFLVNQASERDMPLIICISLGSNYGAHNGTDIIESYLEGLSSTTNIIIVTAAGNEGNTGHHYQGNVAAATPEDVELNVSEGESGFTVFMWTPAPSRLQIAVRSPLGKVIERIAIVEGPQTFRFNLENTVLTVDYLYPAPFTGSEEVSIRLQEPTPGIWTITVYGDNTTIDSRYHMWLPRQGFIEEQTRFLKPTPDTTVQIPGTGEFAFVIGAYDYTDDSIYAGSGRGPTTNNIIRPDIIAPGVNVEGPAPGGGFTTYVGTSTAAAVTASACALLIQWAVIDGNLPQINTRIAKTIIARGARRQRNVIYPNNTEGYGRLDLRNSIGGL